MSTPPIPEIVVAAMEPGEQPIWYGRSRPYPALLDAGVTLITLIIPPIVLVLAGWMLLGPQDRADLIGAFERLVDVAMVAGGGGASLGTGVDSDMLLLLVGLAITLLLLRIVATLLATFGRLIATLWHGLHSHYVVTDRRILILEGPTTTTMKAIAAMRIERGALGANIFFEPADRTIWRGLGQRRIGFCAIADVDRVEALLRSFLIDRSGGPSSLTA